MIVSETFGQYTQYRRYQFPYYPLRADDRDFVWISPENVDIARGLQRGNIYIHLSGGLPEWFTLRFTRLEVKDTPRYHSFGFELLDDLGI